MSEVEDLFAAQLQYLGIEGWVREHRFDGVRRWRFDFAWPVSRVAVEIEGGGYIGGRHSRGAGMEKDAEKYAYAAISGWQVLRVTPKQVKAGTASHWLQLLMGVGRA